MSLHTINWRGSQSYALGSSGRMRFNCSADGVKLKAEQVIAMYNEFEKGKSHKQKPTTCGIKEVVAKPKIEPQKQVENDVKKLPLAVEKQPEIQVEPKKDFESMNIIDLRKEVKKAGIKATFRTPKAELIRLLEGK